MSQISFFNLYKNFMGRRILLLLISVISLSSCLLETEDLPKDAFSMKEMLGRWSDPGGKPGNFIEFKLVKREDMPATEGKYKLKDCLGQELSEGIWNYGALNPLEINMVSNLHDMDKILILKAKDHKNLSLSVFEGADIRSGRVKTRILEDASSFIRLEEADYMPEFL